MEMPVFLPPHIDFCRQAANEDELFHLVTARSSDLINFFKVAADDETWCDEHSDFIRKILQFLTEVSFEDKLSTYDKKEVQQKIHEHYKILYPNLPLNITFKLDENTLPENSLSFSTASIYFEDLIRNEWLKRQSTTVELPGISFEFFKIIEEFVTTGDVQDLWKFPEENLRNFRKTITPFGLTKLEELTESNLKRYLHRYNVVNNLLEAHLSGWISLRHICYEYINDLHLGFKFHETSPKFLGFEFTEFNDHSIDAFDKLKMLITHLYFSGKLIEKREFSDFINQCPLLTFLNLAVSESFSDKILDAPTSLQGLGLSSCNWLNSNALNRVILRFPHLKELKLSDNIQLDYNSWGLLPKLKSLVSLDISKNPQISDDDFRLIVQSTPRLVELNCSYCKKVGDKGFFELTRSLNYLIFLDLERCQISDGLLIEIAVKSRFLEEINLTHCQQLTDRGIIELVKQARALRQITIRQCNIRDQTIAEIKRLKPSLHVIL